jgi:hypothetical protein
MTARTSEAAKAKRENKIELPCSNPNGCSGRIFLKDKVCSECGHNVPLEQSEWLKRRTVERRLGFDRS